MDRAYWFEIGHFLPGEKVVSQQSGVRLYDGEDKVQTLVVGYGVLAESEFIGLVERSWSKEVKLVIGRWIYRGSCLPIVQSLHCTGSEYTPARENHRLVSRTLAEQTLCTYVVSVAFPYTEAVLPSWCTIIHWQHIN